uniref:LHFPL tetraspan subfamily member 4b n=1 Tax=Neogobius melanostomus TaxID=47308 RepID=A0A8C6TD40_9GOBI
MSGSPALSDLSRLYQTEFVRSARAVGVLWAVCTLCFAVIQVVILIQPSWVGTEASLHQGRGPEPPSGTLGLFEVCVDSDWPSVAVLVGLSLWAVWTSVLCLALFRFCSAATVYKICAWLQLTAGFCLALACLLFPDSWENPEMRALCGDHVTSFSPGRSILATLAFVLANRQDALLPPDTKDGETICSYYPGILLFQLLCT